MQHVTSLHSGIYDNIGDLNVTGNVALGVVNLESDYLLLKNCIHFEEFSPKRRRNALK